MWLWWRQWWRCTSFMCGRALARARVSGVARPSSHRSPCRPGRVRVRPGLPRLPCCLPPRQGPVTRLHPVHRVHRGLVRRVRQLCRGLVLRVHRGLGQRVHCGPVQRVHFGPVQRVHFSAPSALAPVCRVRLPAATRRASSSPIVGPGSATDGVACAPPPAPGGASTPCRRRTAQRRRRPRPALPWRRRRRRGDHAIPAAPCRRGVGDAAIAGTTPSAPLHACAVPETPTWLLPKRSRP